MNALRDSMTHRRDDAPGAILKTLVFFLHLALIVVASLLPAFHPGVALAFDAPRAWLCFVLIPAASLLAFYGARLPRVRNIPAQAFVAGLLAVATAFVAGLGETFLAAAFTALVAYALAFLAFRRGLVRVLYVEPVGIVWVAWRVAGFSRSSSAMAAASLVPAAAICAVALAAWCVYACMIYALEYRDRAEAAPRAGYAKVGLFALALILAFSLVLIRAPEAITDFVQRLNTADNRLSPPQKGSENGLKAADSDGNAQNGDQKKNGTQGKNGEGSTGDGELLVAGDENWRKKPTGEGGDGGQYMIMVVEAPVDPLYLAGSYHETLDPVAGFLADEGFYLNELTTAPYLETWENARPMNDRYREPVWIDAYSTIPDKVTSWLPYLVEPTVLDERNFPLRYHYRAMSMVSACSLGEFTPYVAELSEADREAVAPCLDVPLSPEELVPFTDYLDTLLAEETGISGKIERILKGFSAYQYEASANDDVSVAAIKRFLFSAKTGDCTEFSNAAALLGRIAGIPSRVVTGYALKRELQTKKHRDGIREIQKSFAPLAGKDPDSLFLVTTAHSHSWPQFYLPGAGWVDFESTQYAKAPEAGGDPNGGDIVIPRFDADSAAKNRVPFPWILLAKIALGAAGTAIAIALGRRFLILAALAVRARSMDEGGTKARFRLFLIRLAARGYRAKRHGETASEYGSSYPELSRAMSLYDRAILHPDEGQRLAARAELDSEIRSILAGKKGLRATFFEALGFRDGGLL